MSDDKKNLQPSISDVADTIISGNQAVSFLELNKTQLENISIYDFSEYLYIKTPEAMEPDIVDISDFSITQDIGDAHELLFLRDLNLRIQDEIRSCVGTDPDSELILENKSILCEYLITTLEAEQDSLITLVNIYKNTLECGQTTQYIISIQVVPSFTTPFTFFKNATRLLVDGHLNNLNETMYYHWKMVASIADTTWTQQLIERLAEETKRLSLLIQYPFEIYRPKSWNLGLRVVYRQEWKSLGNQRGEIVRTIPLGPKQVEKVSTKVIRRFKVAKTAESLKSVEETTEVVESTKDANEIMNEAARAFNWFFEAEASVNLGPVEASIGGGMDESTEKHSTETNNLINETIQKTASKIRTETKTVVSTESESTFEMTTASEIINPNEEIPITYVYSKLLRQYEIFTSLAEIQNVIMIAEPVPFPYQINFEWVKKYDWIISKVLLDDSFRDALTSISLDPKPLDYKDIANILDNKLQGIQTFYEKFAEMTGGGGIALSGVDMLQNAQINYREALQKKYEYRQQIELLERKRERLYQHIRDNILNYCRAIWQNEDPQQRLLRYKKLAKEELKIPLDWKFVGKLGEEDIDENNIDDFLDTIIALEVALDTEEPYELEGYFESVEGSEVEITKLINPAGPIGFIGNYAIYYIRSENIGPDILSMFDLLKTPYLYYEETSEGVLPSEGKLMDPILKKYTLECRDPGYQFDLSDRVKEEMLDYVSELREEHTKAKEEGSEAEQDFLNNDSKFKEYYPIFLFRKEMSRRFPLDTNNLIIDIEPGTGTALEPFKLAHRSIDVLKTQEELIELQLENKRRKKLLRKNLYDSKFWPGAQKMFFYESGKQLKPGKSQTVSYGYFVSELTFLANLVEKLDALEIETTLELLEKCRTPEQRKMLAMALSMAETELTQISNLADLMRIKGIGEFEANMLEKINVDTVKKLRNKRADNLHESIVNYLKDSDIPPPSLQEVANWIMQAKELEPILEY